MKASNNNKEKTSIRIDKYLWSIRIFKTRNLASEACDAGRVKINDQAVKASKHVHIGDKYVIKDKERNWIIKVTGLLDTRKAYSEAINYYQDLTPIEEQTKVKPLAESFFTGKRLSKIGRPTKKDRRGLDEFFDEN